MADNTVEIFNNTIQWGEYNNNARTLFSTDANTRYVVKDVQVTSNTYSTSPTLRINSFPVNALSSNLTGSEIVDINSTVDVFTDTSGFYIDVGSYNSNVPDIYTNLSTGLIFGPALTSAAASIGTKTNITNGFTNTSSVRAWWFVNGNFYYHCFDGNSITQLYRRVEGVNGTQSTITNNSYAPVVFDGVSKFYYVVSGVIYVHNALTNQTVPFAYPGWQSGTTYASLSFCNGVLFWCHTNGGSLEWYNVATGAMGSLGGSISNYSSYTAPMVFFNSANYTYRIVWGSVGFSSNFWFGDIQSNATNSSMTVTNYGSLTTNLTYRFGHQWNAGGNYGVVFGTNTDSFYYDTVLIIDRNLKPIATKKISGANFYNDNAPMPIVYPSPTTEQKNLAGPSIRLRITGVKTV